MDSIQKTARIAGIAYLVQIAASILGYIPPQTLVSGDIAKTTAAIMANEELFRIGIASNLVTYLTVLVLTWALYLLLRPVNKDLALLAVFMRLAEIIVLSGGVVDELLTLRLLTHADYLKQLEASQLHAFAKVAMATYSRAFDVGFIFLGIGSALFSYVWLMSGYIPRRIAMWGIFSSLLIGVGTFAVILIPSLKTVLFPYSYGLMGIYEVGLGGWLLVKGLTIPEMKFVH